MWIKWVTCFKLCTMELVSAHKTKLFNTCPWWLKDPRNVNEVVRIHPWLLYDVPDYLKTQEMCNEAIEKAPWLLFDVPDCFRNLRMSIRAIHPLRFITPGHPNAQEACETAVEKDPWQLKYVRDHFKTEKMCERAVQKNPSCLKYSLITSRQRKCVKKLLEMIHTPNNLYQITLSPWGCVKWSLT